MAKVETVCVLFGGVSTEHLISCISAANIIEGLRAGGLEVIPVGITTEGEWLSYTGPLDVLRSGAEWTSYTSYKGEPTARDLASPQDFLIWHCGKVKPDVVFPAMHGINCEDGVLQGFLEMCRIPYVGSGVLASAAGMDKSFAKMIFDSVGIPQVPHQVRRRREIAQDAAKVAEDILTELSLPLFLKPANGGSSVGTKQAATVEELAEALKEVSEYDEKVLVETFVNAREIEVAVMGNDRAEAAVPGEIVKAGDVVYYDYETKYFKQGANVALPADIPADLAEEIMSLALTAYKALGCAGLARVDFFLDKDSGDLYLNEVNTMPGFTAISLYPMAWETSGLDRQQLLRILCELAVEQQELMLRRTFA